MNGDALAGLGILIAVVAGFFSFFALIMRIYMQYGFLNTMLVLLAIGLSFIAIGTAISKSDL